MAEPSLIGGFDLGFQEQIDFFRAKLRLPTDKWDDIWQAEHDRAFVVAGATKADLLADLAQAVDKAISTGTTLETFRKDFRKIVADHGWQGWTGEGTPGGFAWRTKVIYETNLRSSYAAGREAQLADPGLQKLMPYRRYVHNDSVINPRPQHLAWNGLTLPHDHPFWKTHSPPNGWSCFPADAPIRCDAKIGLKTWYAGKMVKLKTAAGKRLTVTANHPVLTRRGWVAAGLVENGDQLIGTALDVDPSLIGVVNNDHPPVSAENLFQSLAANGLRVVPMAPDDFHGDAQLRKPEIYVAGSDSVLVDVINLAQHQRISEHRLDVTLHRGIEPTDISRGASLAATIVNDAVFAQDSADSWLGETKARSNLSLADQPPTVQRNNLTFDTIVSGVRGRPGGAHDGFRLAALTDAGPANLHRGAAVAQNYAMQAEDAAESVAADADLFRDLLEANAGLVAEDQVISVVEFDFSGHVYDFSTETGLIVAGGLIVSNCRCRVVAAVAPRKGDRTEPPAGWNEPGEDGRLPGIDRGWAYAPGASLKDELQTVVADKIKKLPAPLAAALDADTAKVLNRD